MKIGASFAPTFSVSGGATLDEVLDVVISAASEVRDGWQSLGDVAQRVVDQCGADIRDHNIKMRADLNRQRAKRAGLMSNLIITISFNTKRKGHKFEVRPDGNDIDPETFGNRVTNTLLESAIALMSASGLAKWQIVENLQGFVDEVDEQSTASIARAVRVVSQQ